MEILTPENFARRLQDVASYTSKKFPQGYVFFTLVLPGGEDQDCRYVSNGSRDTVINAMKEFIIRNGAGEEWMHDKHNVQLANVEMKPVIRELTDLELFGLMPIPCKVCGAMPFNEVLMTDDGQIHFTRFCCRGSDANPHKLISPPFRRDQSFALGEWHAEQLKEEE